jgi:hypothetical protein
LRTTELLIGGRSPGILLRPCSTNREWVDRGNQAFRHRIRFSSLKRWMTACWYAAKQQRLGMAKPQRMNDLSRTCSEAGAI